MLHAEFQDHRTFGSEEKYILLKVFTIYGHSDHFGYMTWTIYIHCHSLLPRRSTWSLALISRAISVETIFENIDGPRLTPDHGIL